MVGIDDVSGTQVSKEKPSRRRCVALERQVHRHVLRSVAQADPEGKFIGVRWVDVNKGTKEVPKARSRLVGQEFAHRERRDDLYAPTPPLAAARFLLSTCPSQGKRGPGDYRILLLDNKKRLFSMAKFPGMCTLNYLQKIRCLREGHSVGKLDKAMYGTRDAPAEWQANWKEQ